MTSHEVFPRVVADNLRDVSGQPVHQVVVQVSAPETSDRLQELQTTGEKK